MVPLGSLPMGHGVLVSTPSIAAVASQLSPVVDCNAGEADGHYGSRDDCKDLGELWILLSAPEHLQRANDKLSSISSQLTGELPRQF